MRTSNSTAPRRAIRSKTPVNPQNNDSTESLVRFRSSSAPPGSFLQQLSGSRDFIGTPSEFRDQRVSELAASAARNHDDRSSACDFQSLLAKDRQDDSRVEIDILDGSNVFCPISYKEKRNWNVFVVVTCAGRKVSTKEVDCTRNPTWNQTLHLEILPDSAEKSLKFSLMLKEKDFLSEIGMFHLRINDENGRSTFPGISGKTEEIYFTLTEFLLITSFQGQIEFKMKDESRSLKGFKTCISIRVRLLQEKRPNMDVPYVRLVKVFQEPPSERSLIDVDAAAQEILEYFPSASLMSQKLLQFLCLHGRLQRWSESEIVGLQNHAADKNSAFLILSGVFTMHHQNKKPDLVLYETLKSRTFGPNVSFGNQMGIKGPGEWLGEVDLLGGHKKRCSIICRTDQGLTLSMDRRSLETIIEQWHTSAAGYSFSLHGNVLRSSAQVRQTSTLISFFRSFACPLLKHSDDEFLQQVAECASLHIVEAGRHIQNHTEMVSIVCSGMIACIERSDKDCAKCDVPVEGRCLNMLSASSVIGIVRSNHIYRALVSTHLIQLERGALFRIVEACCRSGMERFCGNKKQLNSVLMLYIFNFLSQRFHDIPADSLWFLAQRAVLKCLQGPEEHVQQHSLLLQGQVVVHDDLSPKQAGHFFPLSVTASCLEPAVVAVWQKRDAEYFQAIDSPRLKSFVSNDQQSILACLARIPLFQGLSERMLLSILPFVTERHLADKDVVACGNEARHEICVVDEGSVLLFEKHTHSQQHFMSSLRGFDFFVKSYGKEMAQVKAGDCFGQNEFLLRTPSAYTSICKGPVRLLVVDQKCLREIPSLSSLVVINLKGKKKASGSVDQHSHREIESIRLFFWMETRAFCPKVLEASLCMARQATRTSVDSGEEIQLGKDSHNSVLAVHKGLLRYVRERDQAERRQKAAVPDSLEEGEFLDPRALGDELYQREFKFVAVKRSAVLWFPTKSRDFARKVESEYFITAIKEHETFQNAFKNISYFLFDKLARICTKHTHECQDEVYKHKHRSDCIVFLLDGEFKVTRRSFHDAPMASVSPGTFFGHTPQEEKEDGDEGDISESFVVFATARSHTLHISMKDLALILPEESLADIRSQTSSSALHYMQEELASDGEDALAKHKEQPLFLHSSYTSAAMQIFVERVQKGKVTPCYEDEAAWAYGPKPEDVLPSLKMKKKARMLEHRQRLALVKSFRKETAEEENPHRVMGLSKLRHLQKKIDELKEDPRLHRSLKVRIREHKMQVNGHPDFSEKILFNRQLVQDPSLDAKRREEKVVKVERLKEAMTATRQTNLEKDEQRIERTSIAINRKEINDEKRLQTVCEAIRQAKLTRLSAIWLLNMALVTRVSAWKRVVDQVKQVRSDFMLWSAAALSIQRGYRKHLGQRLIVKYDMAAAVIAKFYSKFKMQQRLSRKKEAIPVIFAFLLNVQRTRRTAGYVFRQYRRKVIKIQRAFRQYRNFVTLQDAKLFEMWDRHLDEALKKYALKASRAPSSTTPAGSSKSLYISPDIKLRKLRAFSTAMRRQLLVDKERWRDTFNLWLTREEVRGLLVMIRLFLTACDSIAL
eukprot:768533-Hanusia_phi.AAC.3